MITFKKAAIVLPLLLALVLAGCSSGGTDAGGGAGAATPSLKDKVVGVWKFDFASLKSAKITDEMKKSPQMEPVKKMFESAKIELKADGTYTATDPQGKNETGKWTLSDKTLTTTADKPEDDKNKPTMTVNDDATRIHTVGTQQGETIEVDLVKG